MAETYKTRSRMVAEEILPPGTLCVFGPFLEARGHVRCNRTAVDPHEIKTRGRGGSITDPDNCVPTCRTCHNWVDDHPELAAEYGMVAHNWTPDSEVARLVAEWKAGRR